MFKSSRAESDGLMIWVSRSQRDADGHLGYHLSLESTELKTYSENLVTWWWEEKISAQVQKLELGLNAWFMGEQPASFIQGSFFPQL